MKKRFWGKKKETDLKGRLSESVLFYPEQEKKVLRRRRIRFTIVFFLCFFLYAGIGYVLFLEQIPSKLTFFSKHTEKLDYHLPFTGEISLDEKEVLYVNQKKLSEDVLHLDFDETNYILSDESRSLSCDLKLFGWIPLKKVQVDFIEKTELVPCGNAIGIRMETNGVLILGTSRIQDEAAVSHEPALGIVESGDYIENINGTEILTTETVKEKIQTAPDGVLHMTLRRNGKHIRRTVTAIKNAEGIYQAGIWVRDSTQGIGTLTFIDEKNRFGALGHGITDVDTGILMSVKEGGIYQVNVTGVIKGKKGNPGELLGSLISPDENCIGSIKSNTLQGIFGKSYKNSQNAEKYPIALKQEIHNGRAEILCQVDDSIKRYEIEIERVNQASGETTKGMVIHITDSELLEKTNGIVQGMSGSPILQDGKLAGAVTHVFVNDATRGYGIFIENMLVQ